MAKVIKVYSTPDSLQCTEVKNLLEEHGLPYQELNVTLDFAALKEWMERSCQMDAPMVEIDGDVLVGFDRGLLMQRLGL